MTDLLTTILLGLLLINMVILTHELGHYWAAMSVGFPREILAIGFGPTLWKKKLPSGSMFHLNILPFGGYVKIKETAMKKSPYKRLWVLIAGPLSNFIFACLTTTLLLSIGMKENKTFIGQIMDHTPAKAAKMQPRELIMKMDGQPVQSWHDVLYYSLIHLNTHQPLSVTTTSLGGKPRTTYQLNLSQWKIDPEELNVFKSIGFKPYRPHVNTVLKRFDPKGPAVTSGLKVNDKIIAINKHPMSSWFDIVEFLKSYADQSVTITVLRNNQTKNFNVKLSSKLSQSWRKVGYLGVGPQTAHWPRYARAINILPWPQNFYQALNEIYKQIRLVTLSVKLLIKGNLPLTALSGPLGIANLTVQAVNSGFKIALKTFALLSVMIGTINLLPLPGLDGGQILYTFIELIRRRPITKRWQVLTAQLTLIAMLVLIVQLTIRDIGNMFRIKPPNNIVTQQ